MLVRNVAKLVLLTAAAAPAAGCVSTLPTVDAPSTTMKAKDARVLLAKSLGNLRDVRSARDLRFTGDKLTFVGEVRETGKQTDFSIPFDQMTQLTVDWKRFGQWEWSGGLSYQLLSNEKPLDIGGFSVDFMSKDDALACVDALLITRAAASVSATEEPDFAAFTAEAAAWRMKTPRPAMSDEALTYKLVAEDAFKRKDFPGALKAYGDALERHPMWPDGHYNAALLAGEAEDYELAASHMRRYLALAPDAKDAARAREKLLLWQHKASQ